MIAELPHDVQNFVWDTFTVGINDRREMWRTRVIEGLLHHLDALCGGDVGTREYLLDWLAHLVQFPNKKPTRALLLVGNEESGKYLLITLISRLVPTLQTQDPRQDVYGKFNPLMETVKVVVLENVNRPNLSALASLISDNDINIRKRGSSALIPSYHRVLLTVGEMRGSISGRRFLPIYCSEERIQCPLELLTRVAIETLREVLLSRRVGDEI